VQLALDAWRTVYNLERPHQGLDMGVPADRFRPSSRAMPVRLPEVQYDSSEIVRTVSSTRSYISFKGRMWRGSQALAGGGPSLQAAVAAVDLTNGQRGSDVSEQVSAMSPD